MDRLIAKPQTAVVAGGAGFIGSHLCKRLLQEGFNVVCIDNLYTGRMENIINLLNNPGFKFINHDIINPCRQEDIAVIFNLACPASPIYYQKNAIYTTQTAVIGTMNLLELAQHNKCMIVQASTSEVYGNPEEHPQAESYWGHVNPNGIRSCYDEGKRCAESLCMDYYRQYGTEVKIIRIFNTYGPHMSRDDGRVVSNFIIQALEGKDITIYGNGQQTRSFLYVDDLIEAMVRIMDTEETFTGPVNIGNPEEITIRELAKTVIGVTGSESHIKYCMLPIDDPTRRKPDISLAMEKLSWHPTVHIEEGIERTVRFFEQTKTEKAWTIR